MPLRDWIDHGLLTVFFLVVGLEIKREFTIGHLATRRAAMLPLAAAIGGMTLPALIYSALIPAGPLAAGWGVPIATDTAFAIALIVVLRERVPVELRVFLTAAVIVDDLVAIVVVALFYSGAIDAAYVAAAVAITVALVGLNYAGVYRPLPYAVLGIALWVCLHQAGIHATLAGVILAIVTPTRPPPNLRALIAQADTVIHGEIEYASEGVLRHGPSEPAMRALDAIHDRMESPADKLLRSVEPWSSYFVLPIFALANAGVVLSLDIVNGHTGLILAIVLGLVIGKPLGIVAAAALAVRLGIATKPDAYSWRQLLGAGALGGIGFTMSLFIADQAFPSEPDFAAAKIAIFLASLIAGAAGTLLLWRKGEGSGMRAGCRRLIGALGTLSNRAVRGRRWSARVAAIHGRIMAPIKCVADAALSPSASSRAFVMSTRGSGASRVFEQPVAQRRRWMHRSRPGDGMLVSTQAGVSGRHVGEDHRRGHREIGRARNDQGSARASPNRHCSMSTPRIERFHEPSKAPSDTLPCRQTRRHDHHRGEHGADSENEAERLVGAVFDQFAGEERG